MMKMLSILFLAVPLACAHTHITNLFVNGVDQGDMMCIRAPSDPSKLTFPVEDLSSPDMACGLGGTTGVKRVCPVPDGATLTFQYRKTPGNPSGGYLDTSHTGPCAVYLKRVDNAMTDGATGDGWFKLWDMGFVDGQWCSVKMSNGGGLLTINLPLGLAGGYYLVRPEILALHNANMGDPQYYIGCAQVYVQSSGDLVAQGTVSIPGNCAKGDTADSYNVYNGQNFANYIPPGPPPATFIHSGSGNSNAPMPDGGRPQGCVLEIGSDFCGMEVPEYHDQDSCWTSAKNCWSQAQTCWNQAPSSINQDCNIWQDKCNDINQQCWYNNFNGPPDAGKDLTPTETSRQVPPALGPTRPPNAPAPMYYGNGGGYGSAQSGSQSPQSTGNKAAAASFAPNPNLDGKPWWCQFTSCNKVKREAW